MYLIEPRAGAWDTDPDIIPGITHCTHSAYRKFHNMDDCQLSVIVELAAYILI